jgi:hypothetical protein
VIENRPVGFGYVEVVAEAPLSPTSSGSTRGYTIVNSDGGMTVVGEDSDITAYVQCYFFNEESGQLVIKLKDECVLTKNGRQYAYALNKPVIDPIDAVLNQLSMRTFKMPAGSGDETFALLDGSKTKPRLSHIPGWEWSKEYYDKERAKRIGFASINHIAFDKGSYQLSETGNSFKITLLQEYRNHPGVLYALHDVLGRTSQITRSYEGIF